MGPLRQLRRVSLIGECDGNEADSEGNVSEKLKRENHRAGAANTGPVLGQSRDVRCSDLTHLGLLCDFPREM